MCMDIITYFTRGWSIAPSYLWVGEMTLINMSVVVFLFFTVHAYVTGQN